MSPQPVPAPMTAEEYERALELWPTELLGRVTNALVIPTWIAGEERFWYRLEHLDGHEFVLVDAATGEKRPAFDHAAVAAALGEDPRALPIDGFVEERGALTVTLAGGRTRRIAADGSVEEVSAAPDPAAIAHEGFRGPGGREAFVREHDLWVREADGAERRLTDDGVEFYAWATAMDADLAGPERIDRNNSGLPQISQGVFWSPDGSRLFVLRIDERHLTTYPYTESVRADGGLIPRVHDQRFQIFGDAAGPRLEWYVFDAATGERVRVDDPLEDLSIQPWLAWWTPQGTILGHIHNIAQDAQGLVEIDPATGALRVVHLERDHLLRLNDVWFSEENIRYLPERNEVVWWTQQDGHGHLYAIDVATGAERQLTRGEWAVMDLHLVTETHAYFTAGGRAAGENPYYRKLHRVALDGGPNADLVCLTPENADHAFPPALQGYGYRDAGPVQQHPLRHCLSASGSYFVDNISRVDQATVTVLRDSAGEIVTELARADISRLEEIGWRMPEVFTAKAADGETDVWGVITTPRSFDPAQKLPVMERIYGGHQVLTQPRSFIESLSGNFFYAMHALADLGFAVVVFDGPGTPHRSREFRDMTWDIPDRFGISHHRAVIEDLARTRPWMDLDRVGLNGHSSGGYTSLMGMLLEPDFYRVCVSSSPMLGADGSGAYVNEAHLGRPDYGGGRRTSPGLDELAPSHAKFDPASYIDRLRGRLLLMFGDIDVQCPPQQMLQFMGKLVAAGKSFDTQIMPGQSHYYTTFPYYQKRMWDYFLEHLQGREPLLHHVLDVPAGTRLANT